MSLPADRIISLGFQPYGGTNFDSPRTIANIAALRALSVVGTTDGNVVFLRGKTTDNDGSQANFYYDSLSVDNDDGQNVIKPTIGNGRWKKLTLSSPVNVTTFAMLRLLSVFGLLTGFSIHVLGGDTVGDNKTGIFYYDAACVKADDNYNTISPASGVGKWRRLNLNIGAEVITTNEVLTVGDSLTMLGYYQSTLQAHLGAKFHVQNLGVGGEFAGDTQARFPVYVTANASAKICIIFVGINNIRVGHAATVVEPSLTAMYAMAKAAGMTVVAVTLTPFGLDAGDWTAPKEAERVALNNWIRAVPANVDFVIDADLILRDPAAHQNFLPAYNGDGLHYNATGGGVLGDAMFAGVTWPEITTARSFAINGNTFDQSLHYGSSPTFRTLKLLPGGPYVVPFIIPEGEGLITIGQPGAIENDGLHLYFTDRNGTRRSIAAPGQDLGTVDSPTFKKLTLEELIITAVNSHYAGNFVGANIPDESNGLFIQAGSSHLDKALSVVNHALDTVLFDVDGLGRVTLTKTITPPGTTGDRTINKTTGSFNIAAGQSSCAITNSFVTPDSIIMLCVASDDATLRSVRVVALGGYFLCYGNANATTETRINFFVTN